MRPRGIRGSARPHLGACRGVLSLLESLFPCQHRLALGTWLRAFPIESPIPWIQPRPPNVVFCIG